MFEQYGQICSVSGRIIDNHFSFEFHFHTQIDEFTLYTHTHTTHWMLSSIRVSNKMCCASILVHKCVYHLFCCFWMMKKKNEMRWGGVVVCANKKKKRRNSAKQFLCYIQQISTFFLTFSVYMFAIVQWERLSTNVELNMKKVTTHRIVLQQLSYIIFVLLFFALYALFTWTFLVFMKMFQFFSLMLTNKFGGICYWLSLVELYLFVHVCIRFWCTIEEYATHSIKLLFQWIRWKSSFWQFIEQIVPKKIESKVNLTKIYVQCTMYVYFMQIQYTTSLEW